MYCNHLPLKNIVTFFSVNLYIPHEGSTENRINKICFTIKINLPIFVCICICHEFIYVFVCHWLTSCMQDISKLVTIDETILVPVGKIYNFVLITNFFLILLSS